MSTQELVMERKTNHNINYVKYVFIKQHVQQKTIEISVKLTKKINKKHCLE